MPSSLTKPSPTSSPYSSALLSPCYPKKTRLVATSLPTLQSTTRAAHAAKPTSPSAVPTKYNVYIAKGLIFRGGSNTCFNDAKLASASNGSVSARYTYALRALGRSCSRATARCSSPICTFGEPKTDPKSTAELTTVTCGTARGVL